MASVSGIEAATIAPGRMPRLTMLTAMMMAIACRSDVDEFADGVINHRGLVGNQRRLDAERQVGRSSSPIDSRHVLAKREDVAAVAHGDGQANGRLAVDAEHRLRWIGEAAANFGDVAQPDHAGYSTGS